MKIIQLKTSSFDKQYIKNILSKKTCLIGVFSKLCIHCQNMKPQWEILKKKLKKFKSNAVLLEIDSEQLKYINFNSLTNSINGLPSILLYKNGKQIKEYKGNRSSNDMFKFLKPYLLKANKTQKKNNKRSNLRSHKKSNLT